MTLRTIVYLSFIILGHFELFRVFVNSVKSPCPYAPQNVSIAYRDCSALSHTSGLTLDLKHGVFPSIEADVRDAFIDFCTHSLDINSCVLNHLRLQTCDRSISELYISMATRSNDFCDGTGGLKDDILAFFNVSKPKSLEMIEHCKPSTFDFSLCRRLADYSRNDQIRSTTVDKENQETEYLIELSMCVYSSVVVGCPTDSVILTLLYETEEWLPPHLGANTTEVLEVLFNREKTFY